jgi:hypothetical protein
MKLLYRMSAVYCLLLFCMLTLGITGCKKLVGVDAPVTSINQSNVYADDATAIAVLTGIYTEMSTPGYDLTGNPSISLMAGLSADELTLFSGISNSTNLYYYYTNSLYATSNGTMGADYWSPAYNFIYICNAAIAGLSSSTTLTPSTKQQLLGECYFMRAFFYFYLVNLFGDVPLVTTTNYKVSESLAKTAAPEIYQQIIADLKDAQGLLNSEYLDDNLQPYGPGNLQRVRPTKWAADALLARVYLYTGDYADAVTQSDSLLNNPSLYSLDSLNGVFLMNSTEAIWQLQPVNSQENTADAWLFILPSTGPNTSYPVYLSPQLLGSFEPSDERRLNWVDSVAVGGTIYYYPYKYKSATPNAPLTEYLMVLRLGEQYLIRAEAEAEGAGGGLSGAVADLNIIRARAGLPATTATTQAQVLAAIMHERQVELFTEWGHRWLDLKRSSMVNSVMTIVTPLKANGNPWQSYQQLYPILFSDILADPNLRQNAGY